MTQTSRQMFIHELFLIRYDMPFTCGLKLIFYCVFLLYESEGVVSNGRSMLVAMVSDDND